MEGTSGKVAPVGNLEDHVQMAIHIAKLEIGSISAGEIATLKADLRNARAQTEGAQISIQHLSGMLVDLLKANADLVSNRSPRANKTLLENKVALLELSIEELKERIAWFETAAREGVPARVSRVAQFPAPINAADSYFIPGENSEEAKATGEFEILREQLKRSQEENEMQRDKFRRATHIRAGEIAQDYPKSNHLSSKADDVHTHLNPELKKIDFSSLESILGDDDDDIYNTPQESTNVITPEYPPAADDTLCETEGVSTHF
jgi:hypothetical protein